MANIASFVATVMMKLDASRMVFAAAGTSKCSLELSPPSCDGLPGGSCLLKILLLVVEIELVSPDLFAGLATML